MIKHIFISYRNSGWRSSLEEIITDICGFLSYFLFNLLLQLFLDHLFVIVRCVINRRRRQILCALLSSASFLLFLELTFSSFTSELIQFQLIPFILPQSFINIQLILFFFCIDKPFNGSPPVVGFFFKIVSKNHLFVNVLLWRIWQKEIIHPWLQFLVWKRIEV